MIDFDEHNAYCFMSNLLADPTRVRDTSTYFSILIHHNYIINMENTIFEIPLRFLVIKDRAAEDHVPFWQAMRATFPSLTWTDHNHFQLTSDADCILFRLHQAR